MKSEDNFSFRSSSFYSMCLYLEQTKPQEGAERPMLSLVHIPLTQQFHRHTLYLLSCVVMFEMLKLPK